MSLFVILILILVGLLLLVLEILVIPGFIAGLIGGGLMITGIWGAYRWHGVFYGNVILLSTIVMSFIALYFLLKSKTWKKMALDTKIDSKVNNETDGLFQVGDVGTSVSRLAPMGKAQFGDVYCEVQAKEGWIDQDCEIVIYKIQDNKIIVKLKN